MASSWNAQYVQCPYYRTDDNKMRILCQGVADSSRLAWNFTTKKDFKIQMDTFCCQHYKKCEVYRMLEQIYGEEFYE